MPYKSAFDTNESSNLFQQNDSFNDNMSYNSPFSSIPNPITSINKLTLPMLIGKSVRMPGFKENERGLVVTLDNITNKNVYDAPDLLVHTFHKNGQVDWKYLETCYLNEYKRVNKFNKSLVSQGVKRKYGYDRCEASPKDDEFLKRFYEAKCKDITNEIIAELKDCRNLGKSQLLKDILNSWTMEIYGSEVLKEMFKYFSSNDSVKIISFPKLTNQIIDHSDTKRFVNSIFTELNSCLKPKRDINILKIDEYINQQGLGEKTNRPTYSDYFNGLTLAVHDTWAYRIYLTKYIDFSQADITGKNKSRLVTLRFDIFDHFGLDLADITKPEVIENPFISRAFFLKWFALQHFYGCKPFITTISFEVTRSYEL